MSNKVFTAFCPVDFFIYSPTGNIGIDVFGTDTMHTLQTNINAKLRKYTGFNEKLFFVVIGGSFTQEELDSYTNKKIRVLSSNMKIINMRTLESLISKMTAYPNPLLPL